MTKADTLVAHTLSAARGAACANAADLETYVPVSMIADVAPTLDAHYGDKQGLDDQHIPGGAGCSLPGTSQCVTTGTGKRYDPETETLIVTTGGGFDVAPIYTLAIRGRGDSHDLEYRTDGSANAILTPNGGRGGIGVGAIAFGWQNSAAQGASASEHHSPTLDKSKAPAVGAGMRVRRLTPLECSRLQGFPDGYLDITYRGKPAADGPKYKATGNSWAVNCPFWIGERIEAVEAICAEQQMEAV